MVRDGVASAADAATAGQEDEANGDGAEFASAISFVGLCRIESRIQSNFTKA